MSLHFSESELRKTGDPADLELAEAIANRLEAREDIPFPPSLDSTEPEPKLGFIALHSPETEFLATPIEVTEARATNTERLQAQLRVITQPYTDLFSEKAGTDRAKKLEAPKKRFKLERTKEDEVVEWETTMVQASLDCSYDFTLRYANLEDKASLKFVEMSVYALDSVPFFLTMEFNNELMTKVHLYWDVDKEKRKLINMVPSRSDLGKVIQVIDKHGENVAEHDRKSHVILNPLDGKINVRATNQSRTEEGHLIHNPQTNLYEQRNNQIRNLPNQLDADEALSIFKDVLGLIPTVEY